MEEKKSTRDLAISNATSATSDAIRKLARDPNLAALARASSATAKIAEQMSRQIGPITSATSRIATDMSKQLAPIAAALNSPSVRNMTIQIADQQRRIAELAASMPPITKMPDLPEYVRNSRKEELKLPTIPPNPAYETNKRLARIEKQFERMEKIAVSGAEIGTNLQAWAADFLVKFESVAASNDRTTKRAIRIGIIAIFIALAVPITQTLYTELYKVPQDALAVQRTIEDIKVELSKLQTTQEWAANRLVEALSKNGEEQTKIFNDIREQLSRQNSKN
jgi:hypothetical protein